MQFVVIFRPKARFAKEGAPADLPQVEHAEQVQAKALYKSGGLTQVWTLMTEGKGAVGMFEAATREQLDSMVASFPMIRKDYADADVFPLGPFGAFAE